MAQEQLEIGGVRARTTQVVHKLQKIPIMSKKLKKFEFEAITLTISNACDIILNEEVICVYGTNY